MKKWQKIALVLMAPTLLALYSIANPRWFFRTFTEKTMRCGVVKEKYTGGDSYYIQIMDKDLNRAIAYPVNANRWANFRVGDYTCESLCDWEVNNF